MSQPPPFFSQRFSAFLTQFSLDPPDPNRMMGSLRAAGVLDRDGNKKLALIGDSVLRTHIQIKGYERGMTRGEIDGMVKHLACNAHLAQRGFAARLERYIWNNPSQGTQISEGLMATTVEAIIGAVYLDNGKDLAAIESIITAFGLNWP
ncbi:ribonuclease III domain-containing protein, partial [Aspergillus heterothallicus]